MLTVVSAATLIAVVVDGSGIPDWTADLGPVAEVVPGAPDARVVLICDHASSAIPAALADLGLSPADRLSHAAWDPGAEALSRRLAADLGAPLVLATVSRLVHDLTRPAGAPEAMPARTERIAIPGNAALAPDERGRRAAAIHAPFHRTVDRVISAASRPPTILTIHSFTPVWLDVPRAVEIGVLHDTDPSLAVALMAAAPKGVVARLNEPYSAADGVTYTLARHATARGLPGAMIEVRNDRLADDAGVDRIAAALVAMLTPALAGIAA